MADLQSIAQELKQALEPLSFSKPVAYVYNPLDYAWAAYASYLERYGTSGERILFVGMNPGPFGMVQTGVPFGDIPSVRDWLEIETAIGKPPEEHPKRPVLGFACNRREISGKRVWGWARERFGTPQAFFKRFFVYNYCPLAFMEESGRNLTPDKLSSAESSPLFAACDEALAKVLRYFPVSGVVALGNFAERCAKRVLTTNEVPLYQIPHPSPANPQANQDWAGQVEARLKRFGLL
jgi:single-strand selective monofunctional uracil DNA glycosylase